MKLFKKLDVGLQALFFLLYALALLIADWRIQAVSVLACLGWLLISLFIHHRRHWFAKKHLYRSRFNKAIVLIVLATLGAFISQRFSALALFIGLAVSTSAYLLICLWEIHLLLKRPLSYLK